MKQHGALTIATPTDREIVMTRAFDAPRHLVFEALTRPELVSRWLGVFGEWSMETCEIDLRVGGAYRYVWRGPGGKRMGMGGVYREVEPTWRLVATEQFDESWYPGEALVTTVLTQQGARTTITTTELYQSREARDTALASGMERGVAAGYEALDAVLLSMRATDSIAGRYRARADAFERKVAAVRPDQWDNPSPCTAWTARDVVGHIVEMHGVIFRPLHRTLSPAPSLSDDPLGAFKAARADVETLLDDPELVGTEIDAPMGRMTLEQHVDQVPSTDMVLHGWDLARATGQDDTIDSAEVEEQWAAMNAIPADLMERFRTPGAFGPGVEVFGAEVSVPESAPLQDRLLGLVGRDPAWAPPVSRRV
jgi:uncharacterized protein (TIGR03086 family)